jgi:hypothetical protein
VPIAGAPIKAIRRIQIKQHLQDCLLKNINGRPGKLCNSHYTFYEESTG